MVAVLRRVVWPDGKKFAFTILDDTDRSTVANIKPVYDFLATCGLRTTKTVWALAPTVNTGLGGETLADPAYRDFVLDLHAKGFGVAFHGATSHDSLRERTLEAIELFKTLFGCSPRSHANHHANRDNMYWGASRLTSPAWRAVYRLATLGKNRRFEGHDPQSPYFWGDLCKENIRYVRNFVFREINLFNINPTFPYHDPSKPYVNFWFSSTEASSVESFCHVLRPSEVDRLEREGGVCIAYTHLAAQFFANGTLDAEFKRTIEHLAARQGWFVPIWELFDYLCGIGVGGKEIPPAELAAMERRWIMEKLRHGTS